MSTSTQTDINIAYHKALELKSFKDKAIICGHLT